VEGAVNRSCKCGGVLKRTDIEAVHTLGKRPAFADTDPIKASWKCDKCGIIRTQRKRQPEKEEQE